MSALETLYSGQLTSSTQLVKPNYQEIYWVVLPFFFFQVNTQLFSASEKKQLAELIDTMIAYNVTFHQERNFDGQYTYVLDPWVFVELLSCWKLVICSLLSWLKLHPGLEGFFLLKKYCWKLNLYLDREILTPNFASLPLNPLTPRSD